MSNPEARLAAAGIVLPAPVAPVANYVPFVRTGNLVHISGQVSFDASGGIRGVVGEAVDAETAKAAARLCGINLVAQMRAACDGDQIYTAEPSCGFCGFRVDRLPHHAANTARCVERDLP